MLHYEDFERERLDPIYDIVAPYSEMSKNERYFLNGIIRAIKPKKILEVGVSSGGGSALILNAIHDIDGAKLYSVDYEEKAYRHPDKPSGFLVEEKFPELMSKWHIFRGGDISRYIEKIGGDIDLLMLDTVHTHPWETLNFLCILPFMKKDSSWTVLHDISLFANPYDRYGLACRYLYASVVSEEKVTPVSDSKEIKFANIGAFKVSKLTEKYIGNLFETLLIPWNVQVQKKDLDDIRNIISRYYTPEQYQYFCDVLDFQHYLFTHPMTLKGDLKRIIKQRANPELLAFLQKIKRLLGNK
ncbi:MAG: class I SAM-dependent methyltransferase [Synergistaceae bacterium]|nr:class I SAM-dependent methyltransferase [Synergistaceae bacterium]